jgi:hypothetical protein
MRMSACLICFLILSGGCASSPRSPATTTTPAPPAERPAPTDAPLRVVLDSSVMRYQVESRTVVFAATDTTAPLDSVLIAAQVSLIIRQNASGHIAISGTADRLTVTSGFGQAKTTQSLDSGFKLEWRIVGDTIRVSSQPATTSCDQLQETARDILVSVIPPLPETLVREQKWNSSSLLKSCRSGLMIDVQSRSRIQVANGSAPINRRQVTLRTDGTVTLSGGGQQGATSIVIRGSGTASGNYVLDLVDGSIRSVNTQGRTQIEFDVGYRTDRLIQRTARSITRL